MEKKKKEVIDLVLEGKWYDMIAEGEKKDEYREINPYWCRRLLDAKTIDKERWERLLQRYRANHQLHTLLILFRPVMYKYIRFRRRYTNKTMLYRIERFSIRTGKPEWGAEPDKLYFTFAILPMPETNDD